MAVRQYATYQLTVNLLRAAPFAFAEALVVGNLLLKRSVFQDLPSEASEKLQLSRDTGLVTA